MSRSERYIPPTAEELARMQRAEEAARQFDQDRQTLLRVALVQSKKVDLIELLLRLAEEEKSCSWILERELDVDKPIALLVHDVEAAIKLATKVDELRLNYSFDHDWRAYEAIQFGLAQLIEKNALDEAKTLALKLMRAGSHQIECSDEGSMREEIENCLRLVIAAVAGASDARDWAQEMHSGDRVGFLCESELKELAGLANRRTQV
jgi:hypothetical protein